MSGIESWSTTPANNNQSPPFGWPAGILPSQVEPIGRQMMTSLAAWYQAAEWINYNLTLAYVSATQFTLTGNDTAIYHVGRRVKATDGSTNVYGTITASAFTTLTTVTVAWDSGVLQTGVTIVYVGITSAVNTSSPALSASAFANPSGSVGLTAVNGSATTAMRSDAAPALSQAISPTWTGTHTFSNAVTVAQSVNTRTLNTLQNSSTGTSAAAELAFKNSTNALAINYTGTGWSGVFLTGGPTGEQASIWTSAGAPLTLGTNSTARVSIGPQGNVTVDAPSSGIALSSTGPSSNWAMYAQGSSSSGQSLGLVVQAGTSSADHAMTVRDVTGATAYLDVRGNGLVQAIDQGGTLQDVGWRGTPLNTQSGNYSLVVSDRGKTVQTGVTCTYTVASGVFQAGDVVTLRAASGAVLTIAGSGVTLSWAGNGATTGNRTLTGEGLATLMFTGTNAATISGAGLS